MPIDVTPDDAVEKSHRSTWYTWMDPARFADLDAYAWWTYHAIGQRGASVILQRLERQERTANIVAPGPNNCAP